jgi:signal transduction histidine kinase
VSAAVFVSAVIRMRQGPGLGLAAGFHDPSILWYRHCEEIAVLRTVQVPPELEGIFAAAEETVSRFFQSRRDDPEHGTIEIFGERYILVRAASLSVEFFAQVEQLLGAGREAEADEFARNFLFDLAHALGKADAGNFHRKMDLVDPIAKLSAGPVHFSHSGWAFVVISGESRPLPSDDFYLLFDHPFSFESDAWLRAQKARDFPVCIMNAGWSSGWCEESFGVKLVSSEILCRAKGDETCRFIMAPPGRIEQYVQEYTSRHGAGAHGAGRYAIPDFFVRKRAEEELHRVYNRLKELDELKSQFFANVSHELRTPLMLIAGPVEQLLADETLADEQRDKLDVVRRNARLLLKHVNDLLDVAKLEARKTGLEVRATDLASLVRVCASNFDGFAQGRGIFYDIDVVPELLAVVDLDKTQQVLLNLLSNAFKFTPAGGRIRVTLRHEDHAAVLIVADSGPGISPTLRDAIFERFRQVDGGAARAFGGTGLGLAIAKDFVELHGGTIHVGDAPEGGALFRVELPLTAPTEETIHDGTFAATGRQEAAVAAVEQVASWVLRRAAVPERANEAPANAQTVLVIEDSPDMAQFVASVLGGEYRVVAASDGQEGLEKARAIRPDLIVTDVMMPKLSGDALVREIRKDGTFASVPLLVLTAKADDDLRVRLLGEGAQDYLGKPFSADELLARVRNLATAKRARDILQAELQSRLSDLEQLAKEVTLRKRELQEALKETRLARDQAQEASHAKTTFLRLVSHELTTPLQSMRLNLEYLQRKPGALTVAQLERLGKVSGASNRLLEMIESLLEFIRLESGRLEVHRQEVSLAEIASTVAEDLTQQARKKGLDLRLQGPKELPPCATDPKLLRLILVNLVGNAVKYTDRGYVEVTWEADDRSHRLIVSDTGHGIPVEQQELVFEPFKQLEALRHKHTPGVGLGLTLVREFVKALGGTISVSSKVGRGTIFTVSIPRG